MSLLYEYMTESELAFAKENAIFENESIHIDNSLTVLCMEHETRLNDIELEAFLNGYTESELTDMYDKEMILFTEGVKEIWENFKKWIKGIIDTLLGKAKDVPSEVKEEAKKSNDEVELPANPNKAITFAKNTASKIKNLVKFRNDDGTYNKTGIAIDLAGAAIAGGVSIKGVSDIVSAIKTKTKIKKSEIPGLIDETVEVGKELKDSVDSISNTSDSSLLNTIKEFVSPALNLITSITESLKNALKVAGEKVKDGVEAVKSSVKNSIGKKDEQTISPSDEEFKKRKKEVKQSLIKAAKSMNVFDGSKGNKINVTDMEKIVSELKSKISKGKMKEYENDVKEFEEVIKLMKQNHIMEFTFDDPSEHQLYDELFEESVKTIENESEFDFESFLESDNSETLDELNSLVDAL